MYKPHKKLLILDMSAAFLMSAIDLAFPVVTGKIIDDIIPSKDFRLLIILCASTIFAYGMKYLFEYIVTFYGHNLGLRIEVDLRERVYRHLQSMSFSFYDNQKTGHIISRLTNDIFDISEFAHHGPEDLFISVIILIGSFIAMIQSNVILTVIIFLIVPIMILSAIRNNMKWENAYMDVKKQNGRDLRSS
jgi:ATP-binding cassette subfamily B protein